MYFHVSTDLFSYILLLTQTAATLAAAVPIEPNSIPPLLNATNATNATPWPPEPYQVPNGQPPGSAGMLTFDTYGKHATTQQRDAFASLFSLIKGLPPQFGFRSCVVVVENDPTMNLDPFFFDLRMQQRPAEDSTNKSSNSSSSSSNAMPVYQDMQTMLTTIAAQVSLHGLIEVAANLIFHPTLKGGMQLLIEPTSSMPFEKPLYLHVPISPIPPTTLGHPQVMLEITQFTRKSGSALPLLDTLFEATATLSRRPPAAPFDSVERSIGGYKFSMIGAAPRARDVPFDNAVARQIAHTLFNFEGTLKSTFRFVVWIRRLGEQRSKCLGSGVLESVTGGDGVGGSGSKANGTEDDAGGMFASSLSLDEAMCKGSSLGGPDEGEGKDVVFT